MSLPYLSPKSKQLFTLTEVVLNSKDNKFYGPANLVNFLHFQSQM